MTTQVTIKITTLCSKLLYKKLKSTSKKITTNYEVSLQAFYDKYFSVQPDAEINILEQ
jgi:hypothetical protein